MQNLAKMFEHVNALNAKHPNSPRRFPKGAVAVKAAADNSPTKGNLNSFISAAEARGHHDIWSETSPGSVLLLPTGQSTAAVADIMDVKYDSTTEVVSLTLDVVHDPHTISEFEAHGKQSLDADAAHYHFATAPGVKVDAAGLLKSLQEADFQVDGEFDTQRIVLCQQCWCSQLDTSLVSSVARLAAVLSCGSCQDNGIRHKQPQCM